MISVNQIIASTGIPNFYEILLEALIQIYRGFLKGYLPVLRVGIAEAVQRRFVEALSRAIRGNRIEITY